MSDPAGGVGATAVPDGPGEVVVEAAPEGTVDMALVDGALVGAQARRPRSAATKPTRDVANAVRAHIVSLGVGAAS